MFKLSKAGFALGHLSSDLPDNPHRFVECCSQALDPFCPRLLSLETEDGRSGAYRRRMEGTNTQLPQPTGTRSTHRV